MRVEDEILDVDQLLEQICVLKKENEMLYMQVQDLNNILDRMNDQVFV